MSESFLAQDCNTNIVGKPWVSIILPVYNGAKFLEQALSSVENQLGKHEIELIIADDGSTDESREIIQRFNSKINLRAFYTEHSGNWVKQTNFGLKQARGEFISFLHQDDYWAVDRLQRLSDLSIKFPQADFFLHPSYYVDSSGRILGKWTCPLPAGKLLGSEIILPRLLVQNFISMPAPLIRREFLNSVSQMDEGLWFTADWKLWLSLSIKGRWVYDTKELAYFRLHPHSQTIAGAKHGKNYAEQYTIIHREFFPLLAQIVSEYSPMQEMAKVGADINLAMVDKLQGRKIAYFKLLKSFLLLGPLGIYRLLKYSRIFERVLPRIRLGFAKG